MRRKIPFNFGEVSQEIERAAKGLGFGYFKADGDFGENQYWVRLEFDTENDLNETLGFLRKFEQKEKVDSDSKYAKFAKWLDKKVLYDSAIHRDLKTITIYCPELR